MWHFVTAMLMLSSNRPKRMVTWMWADSIQVTSIHTLSTVLSTLKLTSPVEYFTDQKFRYELSRLDINPDLHSKAVRWIQLDVGGFAGKPLRFCWCDQNSHWSVSSYVGKLHIWSETGLVFYHSSCSPSYDRSIAPSKASSPQTAI